jgi:hypothetical protein
MTMRNADATTIETAIGGAYKMPDGREFWIDAPVAREMTRRVMAALAEASTPSPNDASEQVGS